MKRETENSRQVVDRFLRELGEPLSEEQSERASADVLDRLRARDVRVHASLAPASSTKRSGPHVRVAIAAAMVVMLAGAVLQVALRQPPVIDAVARAVRGEIIESGGRHTLAISKAIEGGTMVRAGAAGGALSLRDGSEVDMSPGAELSIVRVEDGLRVRLASGTVLVTAAKQRNGHLYVETKDCLVSVLGTVFAVSAERTGSRVSVIEGEVHVQRGDISETLLAGQQATTSPELKPLSEDAGTAWIAPERLALLQQQVTPAPAATPPPETQGGVEIRGVVKLASSGAGIPDVKVTLQGARTATYFRYERPLSNQTAPATPPAPTPQAGAIVRNKTFFFAVWDQHAGAAGAATTTTDSVGRFQFSNVAPGDYVVRAEREGFMGASSTGASALPQNTGILRYWTGWSQGPQIPAMTANILEGETQNVTVEAQKTPQELSLLMTRAGVIAGHVRDADGKILVNAQIRVVPGSAGDGPPLVTTITNDLGEYRAYWLPPGEYRVVASGPAGTLFSDSWFPRSASAGEASAVTAREGEEVSGVDVTLRPLQLDVPGRDGILRR